MKGYPQYPSKPFDSIEEARRWVKFFVNWYNKKHLHSGIKFTTPGSRHDGRDVTVLERRKNVYEKAKKENPNRWSKETRNWNRIEKVELNNLTEKLGVDRKRAS